MSEGGKSTVVADSGSADARVGLRGRDEKHARERRRENTLRFETERKNVIPSDDDAHRPDHPRPVPPSTGDAGLNTWE